MLVRHQIAIIVDKNNCVVFLPIIYVSRSITQEGDDPAAMLQPVGAMAAASHRLVVEPRVEAASSHNCLLCPENLCKASIITPS